MKNTLYNDISLTIDDNDATVLADLLIKAKQSDKFVDTYFNTAPARSDEVFFQSFVRDFDVDYRETQLFKKLQVLFSPIADFDFYLKAQIVKITGSLIPHIDPRSCVLTIPLENTICPITWFNDDDTPLHQYYYSTPVLINTHVRHGCLENTQDRYLFQVGIDSKYGDFNQINTLLENVL